MTPISYAILAHSNPKQLERLIAKLNTENVVFFIHIDAKTDIEQFVNCTNNYNNVHFVRNRVDVQWGRYSVLEAYLECLKFIRLIAPDSYVIHLSGQDYPIKSNQYIANFIDRHSDKIFIRHFKLPYTGWAGKGGLDRIYGYVYAVGNKSVVTVKPLNLAPNNIKNILKVLASKPTLFPICMWRFFKKRKYPLDYNSHWGGEFWSSMPINIAGELLDFIDSNKDIEQYYRLCCIPDETMLHTIILNNKGLEDKVVNNCLKYIDWSEKRPNELPLTFTIEDKPEIENAIINMPDKLFARKFGADIQILDYINHLTVTE